MRINKGGFSQIIVIILLIVVGAGAYFLGSQNIFQNPQETPSPTATPDPTANWKTYTNQLHNYQIKYPNDWLMEKRSYEFPYGSIVKDVRFVSPNNYFLLFGLKSKDDDYIITGRTGVGAGEFAMGESLKIGETNVQTSHLVFENKIKEVYYSNRLGPGIISINGFDVIAEFGYEKYNPDLDLTDNNDLKTANQILSTLRFNN